MYSPENRRLLALFEGLLNDWIHTFVDMGSKPLLMGVDCYLLVLSNGLSQLSDKTSL